MTETKAGVQCGAVSLSQRRAPLVSWVSKQPQPQYTFAHLRALCRNTSSAETSTAVRPLSESTLYLLLSAHASVRGVTGNTRQEWRSTNLRAKLSIFLFLLLAATSLAQTSATLPKIRAVTAFIQLDRNSYRVQINETLTKLRQAKAAFEQGGYEVQSIRITTQPFPHYVRGLSKEQALTFFRDYDALARKENFAASIGPAMLSPADDSASAELLAEILSSTTGLEGSIVVAAEKAALLLPLKMVFAGTRCARPPA